MIFLLFSFDFLFLYSNVFVWLFGVLSRCSYRVAMSSSGFAGSNIVGFRIEKNKTVW